MNCTHVQSLERPRAGSCSVCIQCHRIHSIQPHERATTDHSTAVSHFLPYSQLVPESSTHCTMSATSAPFLLLYAQNAFTSLPFILTFLPLLLLTGAWLPLLIAVVLAFVVYLLFNSFANSLSTPTAREAVLITGCSTGLGEAAALHLASVGYTVFATVRKEEDGQALVRNAGRSSQRIAPVLMDITQQSSVEAALAEVSRRVANDRLSFRVLINNAAGVVPKGFCGAELLPPAVLEHSFSFNTVAQLRVTQAFLPLLRATAGRGERARIVFTSSVAGVLGTPCLTSYNAAKAAVEMMADCMRMELRAADIDVCVVQPGTCQLTEAPPVKHAPVADCDAMLWVWTMLIYR